MGMEQDSASIYWIRTPTIWSRKQSMATFASSSFNATRYAAARPTYPKQLYDFIFDNHRKHPAARLETAVDLGCGTGMCHVSCTGLSFFPTDAGQATIGLTPFRHVIGVDPSSKMIESARATIGAVDPKFRFEESSAEDVHALEDGTADLIIAGMPLITRR